MTRAPFSPKMNVSTHLKSNPSNQNNSISSIDLYNTSRLNITTIL